MPSPRSWFTVVVLLISTGWLVLFRGSMPTSDTNVRQRYQLSIAEDHGKLVLALPILAVTLTDGLWSNLNQWFISFQMVFCKDLGNASQELQRCCSKAPLDAITCMDSLKRHPSDVSQVRSSQLCEEAHPDSTERYLFQIGMKHVSVSLPVLTTIQDQMRSAVAACCSGTSDTAACIKGSKLEKAAALASTIDNFCSQYFKLELPAFKTKIQHEFQGDDSKRQAWMDLTTTCCFPHSPAQLCQKLTEAVITYEDAAAA